MFSVIRNAWAKYRDAMRLEHGWPVELRCDGCGHTGVPRYEGWTPSRRVRLGKRPVIYADVFCQDCDRPLKEEAGRRLVEIFGDVSIRRRNRRLILAFLLVVVGVPIAAALVILLGIRAGTWNLSAYRVLAALPILVGPAIVWFNYRIAILRRNCECGEPDYVFMGLLGGSYCMRCGSCGRLMRMRD